MALKHTLVAGITALALLATPVGVSVRWSERGPEIAASSVAPTAHAAPGRPTTKAPSTGAPTVTTSGGSVAKTRGFHPSLFVGQMNEYCQAIADIMDSLADQADYQMSLGNTSHANELFQREITLQAQAESRGCVFVPA